MDKLEPYKSIMWYRKLTLMCASSSSHHLLSVQEKEKKQVRKAYQLANK